MMSRTRADVVLSVEQLLRGAAELRVFLDDDLEFRREPAGWVRAQTRDQAIALLDTGRVIELSLDYDLGDDERYGRGIEVLDWIVDQQGVHGRDLWPRDGIILHTSNPNRDQMARAIERWAGELHRIRRGMTPDGKPQFRFD